MRQAPDFGQVARVDSGLRALIHPTRISSRFAVGANIKKAGSEMALPFLIVPELLNFGSSLGILVFV
ncbi:MAG: hypothetical protein ACYSR1_03355 [Planctomycetota bacterium]